MDVKHLLDQIKDFEMGMEIEDVVTKRKGILTDVYLYLNGCIRFGVSPQANRDGTASEGFSVDFQQCRITKKTKLKLPNARPEKLKKEKSPNGPMQVYK